MNDHKLRCHKITLNSLRELRTHLFFYFRKLFNLSKEDNVCQYVIKRPLPLKEGKKQKYAAPKVQRLVTPIMLQRKRHRLALKRRRAEKNRQATAEYAKILAQRQKEAKEAKELRRKRSASHRESRASKSSISQWFMDVTLYLRYLQILWHISVHFNWWLKLF